MTTQVIPNTVPLVSDNHGDLHSSSIAASFAAINQGGGLDATGNYFRPDGLSAYLRPDGSSYYIRP